MERGAEFSRLLHVAGLLGVDVGPDQREYDLGDEIRNVKNKCPACHAASCGVAKYLPEHVGKITWVEGEPPELRNERETEMAVVARVQQLLVQGRSIEEAAVIVRDEGWRWPPELSPDGQLLTFECRRSLCRLVFQTHERDVNEALRTAIKYKNKTMTLRPVRICTPSRLRRR